jgi:hypothetical protein
VETNVPTQANPKARLAGLAILLALFLLIGLLLFMLSDTGWISAKANLAAMDKHDKSRPALSANQGKSHKATAMSKVQAAVHKDNIPALPTPVTASPIPKVGKVAVHDTKQALQAKTAIQLWQYWLQLLAKLEAQQIPIIGSLLADRLHKQAEPDIYHGISELLNDPTIPNETKALLIDLLGDIATPESLALLVEQAELGIESPLYLFFLEAIARIGDNRWNGQFHEELSPLLEAEWANPAIDDPSYLNAIGTAIAKLGAVTGVEALLNALTINNKNKEKAELDREKQIIALNSIPQVTNPSAIEPLNVCLNQEPVESSAYEICAATIAGTNVPAATQKLIDHATTAPPEAAPAITIAIDSIKAPGAKAPLLKNPKRSFQSPQIEDIFATAAANAEASAIASTPAVNH